MPPIYDVKFLPEGRVIRFSESRRNEYKLADGVRLSMHTTPVWCRHCHRVTEGEEIDSLDEIDRYLADWTDPSSRVCRQFAGFPARDEFLQRMREDAVHRRRWRETRSAPPKCTECGSTAIFVVPIEEPFALPDGSGTIEIRCVGIYDESYPSYDYFTPEGVRARALRKGVAR